MGMKVDATTIPLNAMEKLASRYLDLDLISDRHENDHQGQQIHWRENAPLIIKNRLPQK